MPPTPDTVIPLESLPTAVQQNIQVLVAAESPPPRWLKGKLVHIQSRAWHEWHWARGIDPYKRRPGIPVSLRRAVIGRDGYVCQLCGDPVSLDDVHIDHRLPVALGGKTVLNNLQVTHSLCNLRKGARI